MIDILVPVLGRPQNAAPLVENIRAVTTEEYRITFLCSRGDWAQAEACGDYADTVVVGWEAGPGDYARKINHGAMITAAWQGEWIFQAADDLTFQPGWDTHALAAAGDQFDVVATNDMSNGSVKRGVFGTHNLIRRRYITTTVLYEGYDHNFVDRELCGFAQQAGVYTFARNSRVRHHHPLWRTAPNDPTYVKSLARFREDRELFLSRAHLWGYHGLSPQERRMAA